MEKIHIHLGERGYDILIGSGILSRIGEWLTPFRFGSRIAVVTNSVVRPICGHLVEETLQRSGFRVRMIEIPDGEVYKSLATAGKLYDALVDFDMDRTSTVVALGGGVIGDLAG